MTIGDPRTFAVESIISGAYLRERLRALGCFVIYVGGGRYGVYGPNATLLGCSFDEVAKRVRQRGLHVAPFAKAENPGMIADAFREAIYSENARTSTSAFRESGSAIWSILRISSGHLTVMKPLMMEATFFS